MHKFENPKFYSMVVGLILFGLGLFGLAFATVFSIPTLYLVLALVLGFWGIAVSYKK